MRALKLKAINERRRVAHLIREAVELYLKGQGGIVPPSPTGTETEKKVEKEDALLGIIGLVDTKTPEGSVRHDQYLQRPPGRS